MKIKKELPAGTRLVAVSKYRPVAELQEAYDAGQRLFAESRPAEFAAKADALPGDIEWHFIGHLQTNKLKLVLPRATLIHSVDSIHLLEAIQQFAADNALIVNVLLEVHVGAEATKQGFPPQEVEELFADFPALSQRYPSIRFRGLMGMASHTDDIARIDSDFATLEELFNRIKAGICGGCTDRDGGCTALSDFTELSAGMSDDWHIALRHGSTLVRIGSAIFLR